ncbi:MAG: hypothetical protein AB1627_15155 [Chloroflexota bacterium]
MRIETDQIDGVPVLWSRIEGPRFGALMFGVGRAHEPAAVGGIGHLVEHLALAPLTQQAYGHNGFVAANRTVLHASGTDDELVQFFGHVASALEGLPLGRLLMERRILRQESRERVVATTAQMLWLRFGDVGHGLVGSDELGLGWLGPDRVAAWARSWYTRDNAVLWLSGPPPDGLRLPLPAGRRPEPIPLGTIDGVGFPAHASFGTGSVAISCLAPRGADAVIALSGAARRAREVLRFERGLVYDVRSDYEALDADTAHCLLGADCDAGQAPVVAVSLMRTLDEIAADGLSADEIARERRGYLDAISIPQSGMGFLDGAAQRVLAGRPIEQPDEITAEYEAVTPGATAKAMRTALETVLLRSPGNPPPGRPWRHYPEASTRFVDGKDHRPIGWPLQNRKRKDRLVVGSDGVTWSSGQGQMLTVRYDDCVAYIHRSHWHGGQRELRGADGIRVLVGASDWQGGGRILREMDERMGRELVVCAEHGVDGLPDPQDDQRTG